MTRAVIDVGTNSVKLLVAEVTGEKVTPIWEGSQQTRLGQGFYRSHRLQSGAIDTTARAVAQFAVQARELGAQNVRVIATSAAREAANATVLVKAMERASGLKVEIISGEREADWVFRGVCTDPELACASLLLLDVGGGSMELILGHAGRKDFRESYPIGSVRLLEQVQPGDPPVPPELARCRRQVWDFLEQRVKPAVAPALSVPAQPGGARNGEDARPETSPASKLAPAIQLVGTGGTASILACMEAKLDRFDRGCLEATRLSRQRLHWHVEHLWGMPLEERKTIVGLPKNRADVILTGSAIYEGVVELFGFPQLRVSTRGLRFAAVLPNSTGTGDEVRCR